MAEASEAAQTFLFSDIEGSTRLLTRLGAGYEAVHAGHQRLLRSAWTGAGGREVSTEGDSFFVVFDTAGAALGAAAAAHRALAAHTWPTGAGVRVRIGVHTGQAVRIGDDYLGLDVNRAARVAAAGHGGQTLVSDAVREAAGALPPDLRLRDLGRHRLKDVGAVRLWQLDVAGLPDAFGRLRSLEAHPTNLPAGLGALIDRVSDVEAIGAALAGGGLVTLTGPGGIGKSRVAIEAAAPLVAELPDGVFHLDLAGFDTADRVAARLVELLDLGAADDPEPHAVLAERLRGRSLLLILDNADRVDGVAGLVGGLARACPGLRLLVTSRAPIHVAGEREVPIGPLGLPPVGGPVDAEAIAGSPAVALFVARATEIRPGFVLGPGDLAAVAEICRRLDGLPLAIELAAARTRVLSVRPLLERLARRLPLLAGGPRDAPERQRTMAAAIAWSYDLVTDGERAMLDQLAVFQGSFGLDGAEAVGSRGGAETSDAIVDLESLVERSLVARAEGADDDHAFRLLGTVREFALERLEAGGSAAAARDRHLRYLLTHLGDEQARDDVDDLELARRVERHAPDVAAALDWALPPDRAGAGRDGPDPDDAATARAATARAATGVSLAASMGRHWWLHGHLRDGVAWMERALAAADPDHPALAEVAYWAAVLHEGVGDDARAAELLTGALGRLADAGDRRGEARALNSLGVVARSQDDLDTAQALLHRALAIRREAGDDRGLATVLNNLGLTEIDRGRPEAAVPLLAEAVELDRSTGRRIGSAYSQLAYGAALAGLGRTAEAVVAITASLETFALVEDAEGVADGLDELGRAVGGATPETAARLFLASAALRSRAGARLRAIDERRRRPAVEAALTRVDAGALAGLEREAAVVDVEAAVALARAAAAVVAEP